MSRIIPETTIYIDEVRFNIDLGADELLYENEEIYEIMCNTKYVTLFYDVANQLFGPHITWACVYDNITYSRIASAFACDIKKTFKWECDLDTNTQTDLLKHFLIDYEHVVETNMWRIMGGLSSLACSLLPR